MNVNVYFCNYGNLSFDAFKDCKQAFTQVECNLSIMSTVDMKEMKLVPQTAQTGNYRQTD